MPTIACPQCGKDDMIQKVSAIYSAGIASGSYSGPSAGVAIGSGKPALVGGYATVHGTNQTALSSKLSPPSKPTRRLPPEALIAILLIVIACPVITYREEALRFPVQSSIIGVTGILLLALIIPVGYRQEKRLFQQTEEKIRQWEQAITQWDQLYYCARNDCVFDPATGKAVSPERLSELLYH